MVVLWWVALAEVLLSKSICICSYPPSLYSLVTGSCLLERLVVGMSPPLFHMVLSPSPLVAFMTWFADGQIKVRFPLWVCPWSGKVSLPLFICLLCVEYHCWCGLSYANTVNIWLPLDWNTTVPLAWNWPKPALLLHKPISTTCWLQVPFLSDCRGPGSVLGHFLWGRWWTKEPWNRFLSEYFGFSLSGSSNVPYWYLIHLPLTLYNHGFW